MYLTSFGRTASRLAILAASGLFLLSASQSDAQIFHKKKKVNKSTSAENDAQPDKILYDKAMDDIKHGRHEVGRLNLQTLINTYPDSEYLAKAKLAIGDSFFKEGGTANTTQAIQAYEDFYVFFPMMPEAAYAKLQVAMAHFRQMEKPDRDRTEARAAEDAFQVFLQKFPNDPLAPKAEQHLREVQEVLAEGDYRIGYFYYYTKGDKRAAASRLVALVNRYPLYSKADQALWMLGNIWEGTEKKEFAVPYYAKLVRDYPLSPLAPQAKDRLKGLKAPVPQPDPNAVAWMTAEKNAPRQHDSMLKKPTRLFTNGPKDELYAAAQTGKPTMTPESETEQGLDILSGGKPRAGSTVTGLVATVRPGDSGATSGNAENVAPAGTTGSESEPKTGVQPETNPPAAATESSAPPAAPANANAATKTDSPTATAPPATNNGTVKTDATAGTAEQTGDTAKTDAAKTQDASQTGNQDDKKKESTSKKKKGLRKLIPW